MIVEGSDLWACAQIVEKGDPERFRAAMASAVEARARLFPLYAFNVEVARAPWVTVEPMIAEMRLQWWRDALEEIGAGGEVRRHEVVTPLAGVLDAEGVRLLDALIEARRADIEKAPFEDADALWVYLEATGGGLMQVAARVLGDADGRRARALGTAYGLASYLLAVPDLVARGKLPLPDGRPRAVEALARRGLDLLDQARGYPKAPKAAVLPGALALPVLRRAVQDPERVADGALMPSEAMLRFARLKAAVVG